MGIKAMASAAKDTPVRRVLNTNSCNPLVAPGHQKRSAVPRALHGLLDSVIMLCYVMSFVTDASCLSNYKALRIRIEYARVTHRPAPKSISYSAPLVPHMGDSPHKVTALAATTASLRALKMPYFGSCRTWTLGCVPTRRTCVQLQVTAILWIVEHCLDPFWLTSDTVSRKATIPALKTASSR